MQLDQIPLKTAQRNDATPALGRLVKEMGELVCRTYLGKQVKDFCVADTEFRMDTPVSLTATYKSPLGKQCVCRFLFYDFEPVVVEGGLVTHYADEKGWIFQCSSGFLVQNYQPILAMIHRLAEKQVEAAQNAVITGN